MLPGLVQGIIKVLNGLCSYFFFTECNHQSEWKWDEGRNESKDWRFLDGLQTDEEGRWRYYDNGISMPE